MKIRIVYLPIFSILLVSFLSTLISTTIGEVIGFGGHEMSFDQLLSELRSQGSQIVVTTNVASTMSAQELLEGILSWHDKCDELDITIEVQEDILRTPMNVKPSAITQGQLHFLLRFAVKNEKVYVSRTPALEKRIPAKSEGKWDEDEQTIYAFNGKDARSFTKISQTGLIRSGLDRNILTYALRYLETIGIPGVDGNKNRDFARNLLKAKNVKVLPMLEEVDGHMCHVIVSVGGAYWIDVDSNFAMRRRIFLSYITREDPPTIGLSYLTYSQKFAQQNQDIWWPDYTQVIIYTLSGFPADEYGKISSVTNYKVQNIQVGDLSDELFEFNFPPGTMVMDETKDIAYYMPGGIDQLDEAIAKGTKIIDGIVLDEPSRLKPIANLTTGKIVLILLNVLLVAGLSLYVLYKRRAKVKDSNTL